MKFADEPTFRCRQCLDDPYGWIVLECTGLTCERTGQHVAHQFAVRCPCWLKRNADAIRRTAEEAMGKGKRPTATYEHLVDVMNERYTWQKSVTLASRDIRQHAHRDVA